MSFQVIFHHLRTDQHYSINVENVAYWHIPGLWCPLEQIAVYVIAIAIDSLAAGKQLCFYPSGHVKTIDKEVIGNRRMAYEVCRKLPENVRVILCRMRGLESSRFSKLKPKQWKWRRTVTLHFEDHTEDVRQWAQTLERRAFNEQLENWYNAF